MIANYSILYSRHGLKENKIEKSTELAKYGK